ncbi:uncharacterized protein [Elaeis guineensis]|uniref:Uncharacterized protein LOC105049469 n=1 Tax=Elaeis guineensis var. tenera TaxID=51953 RepID=A0A6I9RJ64_ELAGV|nr:uncharacterized protein LOC105049469 [Elaeis guineensis]
MEEPLLHNPSSSTTTTTDDMEETSSLSSLSSTTTIVIRLSTIIAVAAISLWANYEASKGFQISIVKAAAGSHAGHRFNLMFVSNGRAARIVHHAGQLVERALYPNNLYPRKPVDRVTLRMASHNLTTTVSVTSGVGPADFIIDLSPSLMSMPDTNAALASAVQRGMARVWLWDGGGTAPEPLLEAMVDYLAMIAGFASPTQVITNEVSQETDGTCWSGEFLRHCEGRRQGFIARLNGAMRGRWSEVMVDAALGSPVRRMCAGYRSSTGQFRESSDATLESVELRQVM